MRFLVQISFHSVREQAQSKHLQATNLSQSELFLCHTGLIHLFPDPEEQLADFPSDLAQ